MKPLIKYPGGKSSELKIIFDNLPNYINKYIEPFVGGGALFFALNHNNNYINDISKELILNYKYIKEEEPNYYDELEKIDSNWKLLKNKFDLNKLLAIFQQYINNDKSYEIVLNDYINYFTNYTNNTPLFNIRKEENFKFYLDSCILNKFKHLKKLYISNNNDEYMLLKSLEAAVKSSYYTYLRDVYNNPNEYDNLPEVRRAAIYLYIREYCYSSMFRFNKNGYFNVPYGGISYNDKSLKDKIARFKSFETLNILNNTKIYNDDFMDFFGKINNKIKSDDFVFLDPPYDTDFSEYDQNTFDSNDQNRLANYLIKKCKCKFMLIIKETNYIKKLYSNHGLKVRRYSKNYMVSFKNRNKKNVIHLMITNY